MSEVTSYVTVKTEEFEPSTPAPIRRYAELFGIDERARPLLTDQRMAGVWRVLRRQKLINPRVVSLPEEMVARNECYSPGDLVCFFVFDRMLGVLSCANPISSRKKDDVLGAYEVAINLLQRIEESDVALVFHPELGEAIRMVLDHLQQRLNGQNKHLSRSLIERSSGARGHGDTTRIIGRWAVQAMVGLFGQPMLGTTAKIVSVITGEEVHRKTIENWARS